MIEKLQIKSEEEMEKEKKLRDDHKAIDKKSTKTTDLLNRMAILEALHGLD